MANKPFRLTTLLRLREAARNERRSQLADALRAEEAIVERIEVLERQVLALRRQAASEADVGRVNLDRLLDAERYELVLKAEQMVARQQQQQLAAELQRRREALVAADRDVRVLERLREVQEERQRAEEAAREMQQLDEVAGRRHWWEVDA